MQLTIKNLSKTYSNGVKAIDDLSLDISEGMFGLLGPNGAGKTTLMKTIATLQEADHGTIHFNGIDIFENPMELKQSLGYLPQDFGFYPSEKAEDLLDHFALLKGISDNKQRKETVEYYLKKVNLWDDRKKKIGTFSGGMRQRYGIALALIGNPKLLIVDEPTAGLDPAERNRFHNLLSEVSEDTIVIISTHIVEDVTQICTKMAIINQGKILYQENPIKAIDDLQNNIYEKEIKKSELELYEANHYLLSSRLVAGKTFIRIYSKDTPEKGFNPVSPILEDVYFYHLKQKGGKFDV
jgi:ABC-2 type transport system ATP-binding protein